MIFTLVVAILGVYCGRSFLLGSLVYYGAKKPSVDFLAPILPCKLCIALGDSAPLPSGLDWPGIAFATFQKI